MTTSGMPGSGNLEYPTEAVIIAIPKSYLYSVTYSNSYTAHYRSGTLRPVCMSRDDGSFWSHLSRVSRLYHREHSVKNILSFSLIHLPLWRELQNR